MSEKVLAYAGLTVSKEEVLELIPGAIVRSPAAQGDVLSDVIQLEPTHLILIDGRFHQALPVWHKELLYALMHPTLQGRVYGAASMGALRAADLALHGMIGYGEIFRWYHEGVTADDSEVAVTYTVDQSGDCIPASISLADIRATVALAPEEDRKALFDAAKAIHWTVRTEKSVLDAWKELGFEVEGEAKFVYQKRMDAFGLLKNFRDLPVPGPKNVGPESLSELFMAMLERELKVKVGNQEIALEDVDAAVALTSPYGRRIFEDANNRALALIMCDQMGIGASEEETNQAMAEFTLIHGIKDTDELSSWQMRNAVTMPEFKFLMWTRARIKKLHRTLRISRGYRKATHDVLSYLWNCDRAEAFVKATAENALKEPGPIDDAPPAEKLEAFAKDRSIPLIGNVHEFAVDFGFGNASELAVALSKHCQA